MLASFSASSSTSSSNLIASSPASLPQALSGEGQMSSGGSIPARFGDGGEHLASADGRRSLSLGCRVWDVFATDASGASLNGTLKGTLNGCANVLDPPKAFIGPTTDELERRAAVIDYKAHWSNSSAVALNLWKRHSSLKMSVSCPSLQ